MSQFSREKPIPQIVLDAGDDISKLSLALRYPDFEVREASAWVLGEIGSFPCLAPLVNGLKDPDAVVREACAMALGKIKDKPNLNRKIGIFEDTPDDLWAMNELVKASKDREMRVRAAATAALVNFGKILDAPQPESRNTTSGVQPMTVAIPSTMYMPAGDEAFVGSTAKKDYPPLKRNKPIPQVVLDANYDFQKLDAATRSHEVPVRESAVWALGVMADPRGVVILIQALHDPETAVRESAARALGQIKYNSDTKRSAGRFADMTEDRKAAEALIKLLKDKETNVRASAAAALSKYGTPEVMKLLLGMLADTNANMRAAACTGLGGCPYPDVVLALIRMLRDDDFFTRLCSARSLGRLGDAQALEPLMELLHDNNASVRLNTARALADMGAVGVGTQQFWQRAVDKLIALGTNDSSEEVQSFAQEAVVRLQNRLK